MMSSAPDDDPSPFSLLTSSLSPLTSYPAIFRLRVSPPPIRARHTSPQCGRRSVLASGGERIALINACRAS